MCIPILHYSILFAQIKVKVTKIIYTDFLTKKAGIDRMNLLLETFPVLI